MFNEKPVVGGGPLGGDIGIPDVAKGGRGGGTGNPVDAGGTS